MFRPLKSALVGAGLAVVASAALASPALATTSQSAGLAGCGSNAVAVLTQGQHAPTCFGGTGRHDAHVTGAYQIIAGSHGGVVYYKCGCMWLKKSFKANETVVLDKGSTVTQIDIS